jgi:hypothetical protein
MKEEISSLRRWANERARNASTLEISSGKIDLEEEL